MNHEEIVWPILRGKRVSTRTEKGALKKPGASCLKQRWAGCVPGPVAFYSRYVGPVGVFNKIASILLKTGKGGKAAHSQSCH